MKKIGVIFLVLALVWSIIPASASPDEEKSALVINLLLYNLGKDDDQPIVINFGKSIAVVDDDGDVSVNIETSSRIAFSVDPPLARKLLASLWNVLNDVHTQFSSRSLYVAIRCGDDLLMYTGGSAVIDLLNGGIHPFPSAI